MPTVYPRLIRAALGVYKAVVSPLLGARCRFLPTCSQYAAQVLIDRGPVKGGWLAMRRVCRCHPFGAWGYDPPPAAKDVGRQAAGLKCE